MENNEDNLDQIIEQHLRGKMSNRECQSSQNCPSELELSDYLENRLSAEKEDSLLEHIVDCPNCLFLLELAKSSTKEIVNKPTSEMINRAKNIVHKTTKKTIFDYKWPILASISFLLSFLVSRYFVQFLIMTIILSLKWILDTSSTRTLIMIYEAWRKKDQGTLRRIIQDLPGKIEQRK